MRMQLSAAIAAMVLIGNPARGQESPEAGQAFMNKLADLEGRKVRIDYIDNLNKPQSLSGRVTRFDGKPPNVGTVIVSTDEGKNMGVTFRYGRIELSRQPMFDIKMTLLVEVPPKIAVPPVATAIELDKTRDQRFWIIRYGSMKSPKTEWPSYVMPDAAGGGSITTAIEFIDTPAKPYAIAVQGVPQLWIRFAVRDTERSAFRHQRRTPDGAAYSGYLVLNERGFVTGGSMGRYRLPGDPKAVAPTPEVARRPTEVRPRIETPKPGPNARDEKNKPASQTGVAKRRDESKPAPAADAGIAQLQRLQSLIDARDKEGSDRRAQALEHIKSHPKDSVGHVRLGESQVEEGDFRDAIRTSTRAIELDSQSAAARRLRGVAHYRLGHLAGARKDLDEAIRLDPKNVDAHWKRANVRRASKDFDGALADANAAIDLDPKCAAAYNSRGLIHKAQSQRDSAERDFKRAAELDASDAIALGNLALLRGEVGDDAQCLELLDQAITRDPLHAQSYCRRGKQLEKHGRFADAYVDYTLAIAAEPSLPLGHLHRGELLLGARINAAAIGDLTAAIELDPRSQFAYELRMKAFEKFQIDGPAERDRKTLDALAGIERVKNKFALDHRLPDAKETIGVRLLVDAIRKKDHQFARALLLEEGVDVNERFLDGRTVLHAACETYQPTLVKLLLDHGADPDAKTTDGKTPFQLYRAAYLAGAGGDAGTRERGEATFHGLGDKDLAVHVRFVHDISILKFLKDAATAKHADRESGKKTEAEIADNEQLMLAVIASTPGYRRGSPEANGRETGLLNPAEVGNLQNRFAKDRRDRAEFRASAQMREVVFQLDLAIWLAEVAYGRGDPKFAEVVNSAQRIRRGDDK